MIQRTHCYHTPLLTFTLTAWLILFTADAQAANQLYTGVIYPENELALSLGVSGVAERVLAKQGQRVKAGELLLELRSREQQLEAERRRLLLEDQGEIDTLQQRLAIINEQYQSALPLFENSRSISRDEINQLKLERITISGRIAQLRLEKSRQRIEHQLALEELNVRKLHSPIDGVITHAAISRGEWVKTGEPVMRLVDTSQIYLKLNLPESLASRVTLDQEVEVDIEQVGTRRGVIKYIAPVADAASGLVEIKIDIDNADNLIRPGSKAQILL
jgi:RND family efflux transporter MFP subunit